MSEIEHHLAVEQEFGMDIIYKDGFVATPQQVVQAKRLVRRSKKSQRRSA